MNRASPETLDADWVRRPPPEGANRDRVPSARSGGRRWLGALALPLIAACSGPSGSSSEDAGADMGSAGQTVGRSSSSSGGGSTDGASWADANSSSGGEAIDANPASADNDASGDAPAVDAGLVADDTGSATADATADAPGPANLDGSPDVAADGRAGDGAAIDAASLPPITVYIAGDSTVSQYVLDPNNAKSWAGWGQMIAPHFDSKVKVVDDAVGGRTARRFIQEGHLDAILSTIRPGDYLLVQFGTNDSNMTATYVIGGVTYPYYAAADTDFKTYLGQYITGARAKSAIPVLVAPPPRNSAYCGGARSLANYGQAMIDLGAADGVAVVDLGLKAHAYITAICPKPATAAQETIFKVNPDGTIDGTHFQENGARLLAGFVAQGIAQDGLGLAAYEVP